VGEFALINSVYTILTLGLNVNIMKKILYICVAILFVGAICLISALKVNQKSGNETDIKIGGIFALTGIGADQGEQELNAALLAIQDINDSGGINGRNVKLISGDVSIDRLNIAVSVARHEIDVEKVTAIVGTTWDEPASVMVPIANDLKVPMIGQNQTKMIEKERSYPYFFSTWYDNEIGIKKLLEFAKSKNWHRIAIIRPVADGFYQYVSNEVISLVPNYSIEIIANENLSNPAATDFRTPLTKIKSLKPDAIVVVLGGFTECPFLKQEMELGMDIPILATESALSYSSLNQCSELMKNLYISYPKETKRYDNFTKRYNQKFGRFPETPSVMTTYDAFMIIAQALKKTNGNGGDELRSVIESTKDYEGVSIDKISFDSMGYVLTPQDAFEIRSVKDKEFIHLY
jgi:branched-chain amino acid transport system substrate-binding protein